MENNFDFMNTNEFTNRVKELLEKGLIEGHLELVNNPEYCFLEPDFDDAIVGVTSDGEVLYDDGRIFEIMVFTTEKEENMTDDEYIKYCENYGQNQIDSITEVELNGRKRPKLLSLNTYNYTFREPVL